MRRPRHLVILALAAVVLAGCGEKKETVGDATAIHGPGVRSTPPPWPPEYAHLKERVAQLKLPPVGKERYHVHSLMHVYVDGRLVPLPPNIGVDRKQKIYSAIHTHDPTGIVHMEADKKFKHTLGDLFYVWGVRFGEKSLGSLENRGRDQVRVYVNGKAVPNPVDYEMRDNDNIVVGYGPDDSFPHQPDARALKLVSKKGGGNCSKAANRGGRKGCFAPGAGGGDKSSSDSR